MSYVSDRYFDRLSSLEYSPQSYAAQKYNRLIGEGLVANGNKVVVLNPVDILNKNERKYRIELQENQEFDYLTRSTSNIFRIPITIIKVICFVHSWFVKFPEGFIVIDALKPYTYYAALVACLMKRNCIVIITDMIEHLKIEYNTIASIAKRKYSVMQFNSNVKMATHFVFLTEYMNSRLNKLNKPYCIIEGLVDNPDKIRDRKETKKHCVCLYSGAISKRFGIGNLVAGFISADIKGAELHLYGNGDYVDDLVKICSKNKTIKYMGTLTNNEMIKRQQEATILVNPRPTNDEYTKFSFPSKNIEYMASGTPVLTTRLPGIPEEYWSYVYVIEDESALGIDVALKNVFGKSNVELDDMGKKAKEFVNCYKGKMMQTKKIMDMLECKKVKGNKC
jgi:glycosyltransferase involved in cell wall biosynthesis